MRGYAYVGEDAVGCGVFGAECLGGSEAVDEDCLPAAAVGVGEEVEELEAGRGAEVGRVGVHAEGEVGVRGIFFGEVGGEVPEAT